MKVFQSLIPFGIESNPFCFNIFSTSFQCTLSGFQYFLFFQMEIVEINLPMMFHI